ncbi:MAG: YbaK/EbsC family protein [Anaerolineae bacterium]
MAIVNNVTRLLDQRHISYEAFEVPAEKLGARETAALLGIYAAVVYKTIVVTRDKPRKPLLVLVPGDSVVDLKLVAAALEESGKSRVYLGGLAESLHKRNMQALVKKARGE